MIMRGRFAALVRASDAPAKTLRDTAVELAWGSILLGLVMQILLLVVRRSPTPELQVIAGALGKITWSLLVCTGLGLGRVISQDRPMWTGLAGLVSAPIAFAVAQAVQRAVGEIGAASSGSAWLTSAVILSGVLRAVEYLWLGITLGMISERNGKLPWFLAAGLGAGLLFGWLDIVRTPSTTSSLSGILSWAINQVLFPVGCAFILYVEKTLGRGLVSAATPARG